MSTAGKMAALITPAVWVTTKEEANMVIQPMLLIRIIVMCVEGMLPTMTIVWILPWNSYQG